MIATVSFAENPEASLLLSLVRDALYRRDLRAFDDPRVAQAVDWPRLVRLAIDHDVGGLMCSAVLGSPTAHVPEDIREAADIHLSHHRQKNRESLALLRSLCEDLESNGVPVIPFKGPALAHRLYGDLALRSFKDLDFLVSSDHREQTLDYLFATGYREHIPPLSPAQLAHYRRCNGQAIVFGDSIPVEPHWTCTPRTLAIRLKHEDLWRRAESGVIGTWTTRALCAEDLLIVLCVHGAKEAWGELKWIADIAALIHRYPDLRWEELYRRCRAWGTLRMTLLGLTLAQRLLGASLPERAGRWIADDPVIESLVQYVEGLLFAREEAHPGMYAINRYNLQLRERIQDRLRFVLYSAVTPRVAHFKVWKLPDPLFALYYLLKPFHDFLLLPAWKLLKRSRRN